MLNEFSLALKVRWYFLTFFPSNRLRWVAQSIILLSIAFGKVRSVFSLISYPQSICSEDFSNPLQGRSFLRDFCRVALQHRTNFYGYTLFTSLPLYNCAIYSVNALIFSSTLLISDKVNWSKLIGGVGSVILLREEDRSADVMDRYSFLSISDITLLWSLPMKMVLQCSSKISSSLFSLSLALAYTLPTLAINCCPSLQTHCRHCSRQSCTAGSLMVLQRWCSCAQRGQWKGEGAGHWGERQAESAGWLWGQSAARREDSMCLFLLLYRNIRQAWRCTSVRVYVGVCTRAGAGSSRRA